MAFRKELSFRHRFEFGLAWRTTMLVAAIWLLAEALRTPDLRAARVVAVLIAVAALASLWELIRRTNFQVSRFIESVRFEDYAQRFSDPSGGGFDVLGDTLDAALRTLQARHISASGEARYLSAIVDDSPSALLAIDEDGKLELLNKSARQLLGRHHVVRVGDLSVLGPELAAAAQLPPGSRKVTRLIIDGVPHRAIFASAHVARLEGGVTVLSILPVQSELGALEVAAQADLVRVLTHEIMNSLTPVTSLARSAAEARSYRPNIRRDGEIFRAARLIIAASRWATYSLACVPQMRGRMSSGSAALLGRATTLRPLPLTDPERARRKSSAVISLRSRADEPPSTTPRSERPCRSTVATILRPEEQT